MRKNSNQTQTILDIDSAVGRKQHEAINHWWKKENSLFLPKEYTEICQGCGSHLYKKGKEFYMGEYFCKPCVEMWKSGHK